METLEKAKETTKFAGNKKDLKKWLSEDLFYYRTWSLFEQYNWGG